MKYNPASQEFSVSQKIYAQLLRAYPQRHREEYGAAMTQLFRDQCRDAWNESRGWGLARLWLRVLPDLVNTSIMERIAALNERKSMSDKLANLSSFQNSPAKIFFKVFATVFLIVLIASVAITFILPESYASTARIKVENDQATTTGMAGTPDPYFIQTTFEIIQSQLVLAPVINRLNLNMKWGKKYFAGETLKSAETLEILRGRLSLAPIRNTKLIAITVYSDDAKEAAQIANAVADAYKDFRVRSRAEQWTKGIDVLQQQYKIEDDQIRLTQTELETQRQGSGVSAQLALEKERKLSQLLEFHKLLYAKIEAEKLDAQIPKSSLVQITDMAEPGRAPVKPNKTLNIVLGAFFGILSASVFGAIAAFVVLQIRKRNQQPKATA